MCRCISGPVRSGTLLLMGVEIGAYSIILGIGLFVFAVICYTSGVDGEVCGVVECLLH